MKLYAVVIGRKGRNQRYVALTPFVNSNLLAEKCPLAVYPKMSTAKLAKEEILKTCCHKAVFVIRFVKG